MSFSVSGFKVLPGKGMLAVMAVILALAVGLAYSLTTALQNRVKVDTLEAALKGYKADLEASRAIISTQRAEAAELATTAAKTQEQLNHARNIIRKAGSEIAGGTGSADGAARLRSARDAAEQAIGSVRSGSAPGSVPSGDGSNP